MGIISNENMEIGTELIDLMETDYEEFKVRVDKLPLSSRKEIARWFNRLYLYKVCSEGSA